MTRWSLDDMPGQAGRTVLVTGASDGLGLRTAEALAARGAHVLLACRNPDKGERARARVAAAASGPAPTLVGLDLADLSSVRAAAETVTSAVDRLDLLVNNAGVMAMPFARTVDGVEVQLATNHLGHYALTGLVLPVLLRAPVPRVVTVASNAHRPARNRWGDVDRHLGRWPAYCRSKLANLLFMQELARRAAAAGSGLVSVAAHPGYAATHLATASAEQYRFPLAGAVIRSATRVLAQSDAQGALPQLYAATMADVSSGDYFGPDGRLQMRGHPTRVAPSRAARDPEAAAELWELSARLTGVTCTWDVVPGGAPVVPHD